MHPIITVINIVIQAIMLIISIIFVEKSAPIAPLHYSQRIPLHYVYTHVSYSFSHYFIKAMLLSRIIKLIIINIWQNNVLIIPIL